MPSNKNVRAPRGPNRARPSAGRVAWRVRELADSYGCAAATIYSWIQAGALPASQPSKGLVLVMDADWRRFLASRPASSATPTVVNATA